jgi:hypothetical protein
MNFDIRVELSVVKKIIFDEWTSAYPCNTGAAGTLEITCNVNMYSFYACRARNAVGFATLI